MICCECKKEKSLEEFAKHKKMKDGRDTVCKKCACERTKKHYQENKEERLEYAKEYYENNREEKIEYARMQRANLKNFIEEYKKGKKCAKCDFDKWQILEFHHRDRKTKKFGICRRNSASIKKVKIEIDKCDLLCPNCHREIEYFIEKEKAELNESVSKYTIRRRKFKVWYNGLKEETGCRCGEKRFWVLDAHHRDEEKKEGELHLMVHNMNAKERIINELEKCDILCANDHQWHHYLERQ